MQKLKKIYVEILTVLIWGSGVWVRYLLFPGRLTERKSPEELEANVRSGTQAALYERTEIFQPRICGRATTKSSSDWTPKLAWSSSDLCGWKWIWNGIDHQVKKRMKNDRESKSYSGCFPDKDRFEPKLPTELRLCSLGLTEWFSSKEVSDKSSPLYQSRLDHSLTEWLPAGFEWKP